MVPAKQQNAKKWMDASKFPFPVLADPLFEFYRELGLRRSVKNAFKLEILAKYAANVAAGIPIGPSAPYLGDDLYLMAGDFIADSLGRLVYVYNAQHAHDRPSIENILSGLDAAHVHGV